MRSSSSRRFSIAQPVEITIKPPPTCTTGSEIPKKARMWVPIRYEPNSRKKLFIAIRRESDLRPKVEYSLVNDKKIGSETLNDNQPGEFYTATYDIPSDVVAGKDRMTVRFQALPNHMAGGVFGLRVVKKGP